MCGGNVGSEYKYQYNQSQTDECDYQTWHLPLLGRSESQQIRPIIDNTYLSHSNYRLPTACVIILIYLLFSNSPSSTIFTFIHRHNFTPRLLPGPHQKLNFSDVSGWPNRMQGQSCNILLLGIFVVKLLGLISSSLHSLGDENISNSRLRRTGWNNNSLFDLHPNCTFQI